ncbi:MAG: DNA primase [Synergistaceae bacterium]|nr:DNA primase [Synergistaceae bacterium]
MGTTERIKGSLDIAEIIGERVKLRRSGRGYVGSCPFHDEKTPSFHVYEDSYYCFGCHEAGDVFSFIMKIDGLGFQDALKILAERAGVQLPGYESDFMEQAFEFYRENIRSGTFARTYLKRRGLDESDIEKFSLGYSLNSWDSLVKYLGAAPTELTIQGKYGAYDRLRGRVVFPIRNVGGKIVAFGGRLVDGEGAKYLNTPYEKGKHLYLLDIAKKAILEKKRAIVVEGYMDAIRLHKAGFTETVASLGTALTTDQVKLLSRYTDKCFICYDGDSAGRTAAIRGANLLSELDTYVVNLPQGLDPDEFLLDRTPDDFEKLLLEARPFVLHEIEMATSVKKLFEDLLQLPPEKVLKFKSKLCAVSGMQPSRIEEIFTTKRFEHVAPVVEKKPTENPYEAALCYLLSQNPVLLKVEEILELVHDENLQSFALGLATENHDDYMKIQASIGSYDWCMGVLTRGRVVYENFDWQTIYEKLKFLKRKREFDEIRAKMYKSTATPEELAKLTSFFSSRGTYPVKTSE